MSDVNKPAGPAAVADPAKPPVPQTTAPVAPVSAPAVPPAPAITLPKAPDGQMTLRVNGESRQESYSGNMSVTIPEILSHYSALGYSAGDVVSTGTVSGVAGFSEDAASLYLKPGDVIEAEIEKIGILRNPVISWQDAHGEPAPPRVAW